MDTTSGPIENAVYRERLQQAKRVMEGLSEEQRSINFDIRGFARESEWGVIACTAGHCGLDPWFQANGFETDITEGTVSIRPEEFFGTRQPFYQSAYGHFPVTFDDALRALDRAIDSLTDDSCVPVHSAA